jgi:hypothetical protein
MATLFIHASAAEDFLSAGGGDVVKLYVTYTNSNNIHRLCFGINVLNNKRNKRNYIIL